MFLQKEPGVIGAKNGTPVGEWAVVMIMFLVAWPKTADGNEEAQP